MYVEEGTTTTTRRCPLAGPRKDSISTSRISLACRITRDKWASSNAESASVTHYLIEHLSTDQFNTMMDSLKKGEDMNTALCWPPGRSGTSSGPVEIATWDANGRSSRPRLRSDWSTSARRWATTRDRPRKRSRSERRNVRPARASEPALFLYDEDVMSDMLMRFSMPVVAIVGRPNVGKSSLLNRLCGKRQWPSVHAPRGPLATA